MDDQNIFRFKDHTVDLNKNVLIMGILNITPDSFSEDGLNFNPEVAVKNALKMIREGADIIDIGGESTRPGANPITEQEEIRRVLPVLRELRRQCEIPISIDTYKSEVARIAVRNGADIINDISGFQRDKDMKNVAKEFGAGCIVMHMRGTPKSMQSDLNYHDIIAEIIDFFHQSTTMLLDAGIERDYICLDPGIGFSKNVDQNLYLIRNLPIFIQLGWPLLLGVSRKSFIGKILKIDSPADRIWGTAASLCYAIYQGVKIVRVHDVLEMRQLCDMTSAILEAPTAVNNYFLK